MKRRILLIATLCLTAVLCVIGLIACNSTISPTAITLNKTGIVLGVGDSETLTATIAPENATDKTVIWESSNESVATVDGGAVSAMAEGTATITAKTKDGALSDVCQVEVVKAGMAKFFYTETADSCTITGLRDYSVTEIVIPDCVTDIDADAFYDAELLCVVSVGNGIESIDDDWFSNCNNLSSITLGENVQSIGESAFVFSENLIEVISKSPFLTIEKGAESNGHVGRYALSVSNCDSTYQRKVEVNADGLVTFTEGTEKTLKLFVGRKSEIVIPNGITAIDEYLFADCDFLTSVIFPDGITSMGVGVFYGCSSIKTIVLGSGISEISAYTFYGCTSLELVEMQSGVTTISQSAFEGCTHLEGVVISAELETVREDAFKDCASIKSVFKRDMRGSGGMSAIDIWSGNASLHNCTFYYYSPEKPTWLGNFWHYVDGKPTPWN